MRVALRRRIGFTLIEVLMVFGMMAVLAATIIPILLPASRNRKMDSLEFKTRMLRAQIELYREHHQGVWPRVQDNSLPQLTLYSDGQGNTSEMADSTKLFGPYISGALPNNPFDGRNRVVEVVLHGQTPKTVADDGGGWQYDSNSGLIWPNNPEYYRVAQPERADLAANQ